MLNLNRDWLIFFVVKVSFFSFWWFWWRLVYDDVADPGDSPAAAEDSHVSVLSSVHKPESALYSI